MSDSQLCAPVERVARDGVRSLDEHDVALLEEYAEPCEYGHEDQVADQLDGWTREMVAELTGRDDVWSEPRASRALLAKVRALRATVRP